MSPLSAARTARFAPMEDAVRLSGVEYDGITPVGIPSGWAFSLAPRVAAVPLAIVDGLAKEPV